MHRARRAANRRPHEQPRIREVPLYLPSSALAELACARSCTALDPQLNIAWHHACFIARAIILHSSTPSHWIACKTTSPLTARRVHVEPRPPDIEESSEFSRTLAGKDGIRKGRNVPSPPRHMLVQAATDTTTVQSTCSSLALDPRVLEQQSAFTRLYARASAHVGGASAKSIRMAPHG